MVFSRRRLGLAVVALTLGGGILLIVGQNHAPAVQNQDKREEPLGGDLSEQRCRPHSAPVAVPQSVKNSPDGVPDEIDAWLIELGALPAIDGTVTQSFDLLLDHVDRIRAAARWFRAHPETAGPVLIAAFAQVSDLRAKVMIALVLESQRGLGQPTILEALKNATTDLQRYLYTTILWQPREMFFDEDAAERMLWRNVVYMQVMSARFACGMEEAQGDAVQAVHGQDLSVEEAADQSWPPPRRGVEGWKRPAWFADDKASALTRDLIRNQKLSSWILMDYYGTVEYAAVGGDRASAEWLRDTFSPASPDAGWIASQSFKGVARGLPIDEANEALFAMVQRAIETPGSADSVFGALFELMGDRADDEAPEGYRPGWGVEFWPFARHLFQDVPSETTFKFASWSKFRPMVPPDADEFLSVQAATNPSQRARAIALTGLLDSFPKSHLSMEAEIRALRDLSPRVRWTAAYAAYCHGFRDWVTVRGSQKLKPCDDPVGQHGFLALVPQFERLVLDPEEDARVRYRAWQAVSVLAPDHLDRLPQIPKPPPSNWEAD